MPSRDPKPNPSTIRGRHAFGSPECGYVMPEQAKNRLGLGFDYCTGTFGECVTPHSCAV